MRRNLIGKQFGKITVLEPTDQRIRNGIVWRCRCQCGNEVLIEGRKLKEGVTFSCGCEPAPKIGSDLTNLRFGSLIVLESTGQLDSSRNIIWRCRCDCGNLTTAIRGQLIRGQKRSCGCMRKQTIKPLEGKNYGLLTVKSYDSYRNGQHYWVCQCSCGKEIVVRQNNLESGSSTSCGCVRMPQKVLHFVEGTQIERLTSTQLSKANTSGAKGVYYSKKRGKWIAQIKFKGHCYYLGGYTELEDAVKARRESEEQLFGNFLQWYSERNNLKTEEES